MQAASTAQALSGTGGLLRSRASITSRGFVPDMFRPELSPMTVATVAKTPG